MLALKIQISGAFTLQDGFHRADWEAIRRWIEESIPPEEQDQAWREAVVWWLGLLRDDLGGDYVLHESEQTLLLSDQPQEVVRWIVNYVAQSIIDPRPIG